MWPNPQETADLVTFTEEILDGKLHFLCTVYWRSLSRIISENLGSSGGKHLWWSSVLVKPLSLWFTINLLINFKLMVLWNSLMILWNLTWDFGWFLLNFNCTHFNHAYKKEKMAKHLSLKKKPSFIISVTN